MSGAGAPDFFRREVLRLGYVARFAFKLLQMQNKYKLITRGSAVLDLGCASGAWLQVACQSLGPLKNGGSVVGIDLKLGMRALGVAIGRAAGGDMVDGSLEDSNDDDGVLQIGGRLIIKLLESEDVQEFNQICKPLFRKTSWLRPKATRPSSREIYLICQDLQWRT
ncbi:hypothetical protein CRG98_007231 [Punica granatum]|uniref:rRNA methyltransferase 2, mitochondrial n=1 Tax=Punica granatum TaxID=22663 RepID=A0A2I0KV65_PUNGR|nr:hypothetical protein CRG98_007231 [Punica granatum]